VPYRFTTSADGTDLHRRGVRPHDLFLKGRFLQRSRRDLRVIQPTAYCGSVATRHLVDDAHLSGATSLGQAVDLALEHVASSRGPTLTYLYWPEPDTTAHRLGTHDARTIAVLHALDAALERLADGLAARASGRTRLVVTADHGHLDAPVSGWNRLDPHGPLAATLRSPPAGEPRALTFHVRPGREVEFRDRVVESLGSTFFLISADDVVALRLLGPEPMSSEVRARLGDLLAVSCGEFVSEMSLPGRERGMALRSNHGGLTPDETLVPLVLG
jgi:hypothetical protein